MFPPTANRSGLSGAYETLTVKVTNAKFQNSRTFTKCAGTGREIIGDASGKEFPVPNEDSQRFLTIAIYPRVLEQARAGPSAHKSAEKSISTAKI